MKAKQHSLEALAGVLIVAMVMAVVVLRSGIASGYPVGPTPTPGIPHGGNYHAYLPVMQACNPAYMKCKSGVHLGSGVSTDWPLPTEQPRLTGGTPGQGAWPAMITVLSQDVFQFTRDTTSPCYIKTAANSVTLANSSLYNYLTTAAQAGTHIVIRIYPSPGNFGNVFGGDANRHELLYTPGADRPVIWNGYTYVPADYCTNGPGPGPSGVNYFRPVEDIANEIIAIRNYTLGSGWKPFAFEGASEPNAEWYPGNFQIDLQDPTVWTQMDNYFAALYFAVHPDSAHNTDINVLAPPMAQQDYAEALNIIDCSAYPGPAGGGLFYMQDTWLYGGANDGWSWHNYWVYGKENNTGDWSCAPGNEHNIDAFPQAIKDQIRQHQRPALITEADVFSPCEAWPGGISTKGDYNNDPNDVAGHIKTFISQEPAAWYVAIWNMNIAYSNNQGQDCPGMDTDQHKNDSYAWHQAFTKSSPNERAWFRNWWLDSTQP